jgi:hypothetical protein
MTSYTVSPWVVIFRRDWQIFGGRFQIHITPDGVYVYHLKTKVRLRRNDFSHIIAPNSKLAIWRCKDRKPLFGDDEDPTNLVHQVRKIFAEEKVECLSLNQKLEDAHISTEETLFVEAPFVFPGMSCISTAFGYVLIHALKPVQLGIIKWSTNSSLITFKCRPKERSQKKTLI